MPTRGLTVVCVRDYDAADAVLRQEPGHHRVTGRTFLNLCADTPARARDTAEWAARHGVRAVPGRRDHDAHGAANGFIRVVEELSRKGAGKEESAAR